jgi:TonB family protein
VHITNLRQISTKQINGDISQPQSKNWISLLPKRVSLVQSSSCNSPMLLGLFSPRLIIPCDFYQAYNQAQQKLIIQHELQHYARGDQLWNIIGTVILALFWFNPLSWLGYRRFRQDQELSCDEGILLNSNKQTKLNYSKALLICSAGQGASQAFGGLGSHYTDSQVIKQRLEAILLPSRTRPGLKYLLILFIGFSAMFSYANNKTGATSLTDKPGMALYPLTRIEPDYPLIAIQQNISGHVLVSFEVNRAGRVINAKVVQAQPAGVFEQSALVALAQWHYQEPSEPRTSSVRLDYRLNDAPALAINANNADIERLLVTD